MLNQMQSGGGQPKESSGQRFDAKTVLVKQGLERGGEVIVLVGPVGFVGLVVLLIVVLVEDLMDVWRLDGGGRVGAVGRQEVEAVLVVVCVGHPCGQAVWQGSSEVWVGVVGQRELVPGTMVVLKNKQSGMMHGFFGSNGAHFLFSTHVVAVWHGH